MSTTMTDLNRTKWNTILNTQSYVLLTAMISAVSMTQPVVSLSISLIVFALFFLLLYNDAKPMIKRRNELYRLQKTTGLTAEQTAEWQQFAASGKSETIIHKICIHTSAALLLYNLFQFYHYCAKTF